MAAVFDVDAIRAQREKLFGSDRTSPAPVPRLSGTSYSHCDICPRDPGQPCGSSCEAERAKLSDGDDGIKVY